MSKVKIQGNASGTGVVTLTAPNTNTDRTITLPDDTQTLIGTNASGNVGIGTSSPTAKLDVADVSGISINNNYAHMGSTNSGAMAIFGHNIKTDSGVSNTVTSANTGYHSSMMKMYYNEGITFHTMNTTATAGDTFYDMVGTTNERMRIDSAGRVTMPYQLHWHGGLTNTGGSGIATSASTRTSRGGLNFVTDRVTVPVAGVYSIHFNTISADSSSRVDAKIMLNGANLLEMLSEVATGYHYKSGSLDVLLAANDYIQFSNDAWYDAAGSSSTTTTWKSASVTLIG